MIETHDDVDRNLRINTVRGRISVGEVISTLIEFYQGEPTLHVLWDLTETDAVGIERQDIDRVLEAVTRLEHSRPGGRTALVAPTDLDFGLSRMFELMANASRLEVEFAVFRSTAEAEAWLFGGGAAE